jgi:hypothetical protein
MSLSLDDDISFASPLSPSYIPATSYKHHRQIFTFKPRHHGATRGHAFEPQGLSKAGSTQW